MQQNNQLKLNMERQKAIRAERDALLAELSAVRQHENVANDKISQFENKTRINHVHNTSIVSHVLDFDA